MDEIFGSDVVLQADFCELFAEDGGVFLVVFLVGADHLHLFEEGDVGVFLEETGDDCSVLEVLVEVGESAFFQQDFVDGLLGPEEQYVF